MTTTTAHATTPAVRCKNPKCNRILTSRKSRAIGYGPTCARNIRRNTADYSPEQTAKAFRLVSGGGVRRIPSTHYRLFEVDGTYGTYQSDGLDCTCAGAREHANCRHSQAVRIFLAAA